MLLIVPVCLFVVYRYLRQDSSWTRVLVRCLFRNLLVSDGTTSHIVEGVVRLGSLSYVSVRKNDLFYRIRCGFK